jgi:aspartyl/glutamyl-tRNA(Asn/Gln) amidotransferase C subunit
MEREMVNKLAKTLLFEVSDSEYEEMHEELDRNISEIEKIGKMQGISSIEPMFYPFDVEVSPREDKVLDELSNDDILKNVSNKQYNQTKLPKVVE